MLSNNIVIEAAAMASKEGLSFAQIDERSPRTTCESPTPRTSELSKMAPLFLVSKKIHTEAIRVCRQAQKVCITPSPGHCIQAFFNHETIWHPTLLDILSHRHLEIRWSKQPGTENSFHVVIEALRSFMYHICETEKVLTLRYGGSLVQGVLNVDKIDAQDRRSADIVSELDQRDLSAAENGSKIWRESVDEWRRLQPQQWTGYRWYSWEQGPCKQRRGNAQHAEFAAWASRLLEEIEKSKITEDSTGTKSAEGPKSAENRSSAASYSAE